MQILKLSLFSRLGIVIGACAVFFFVEIAIGLHTRSLALIVDAFHMLNDLISYIVALIAAKLAQSNKERPGFTFALKRCEVVGAIFNASILLALALAILLQSIERFIEVPEVHNPMLVVIVGGVGLVLNVFAVLVCHEHGHGHSHGHSHGHDHARIQPQHNSGPEPDRQAVNHRSDIDVEQGHSPTYRHNRGHHHPCTHAPTKSYHAHDPLASSAHFDRQLDVQLRGLKVPDVASLIHAPLSRVYPAFHTQSFETTHTERGRDKRHTGDSVATPSWARRSMWSVLGHSFRYPGRDKALTRGVKTPDHGQTPGAKCSGHTPVETQKDRSLDPGSPRFALQGGESWYTDAEGVIRRDRVGRAGLQSVSHSARERMAPGLGQGAQRAGGSGDTVVDGHQPLGRKDVGSERDSQSDHRPQPHHHSHAPDHRHSHSHAHGSHLGIAGVMLHVAGDAINNVGVIVAALIMWLAPWPSRFYADPGVSVLIGLIIFAGALPLTFRSARLLLEAAPKKVNLVKIKEEIEAIPGVASVHCLHIWQLTENDLIGSLDVRASASDLVVWSLVEAQIRRVLGEHRVEHATIAPQFVIVQRVDEGQDEDQGQDTVGVEARREGDHAAKSRDERSSCVILR